MIEHDLIVIGGGNAAALSIAAGKAGWSVALIEEGPLGGVCPNRGCIPSKLLLAYSEVAETIRDAGRFRISATIDAIDVKQVLADVQAATRPTDEKIAGALPQNVTLHRGRGRFVGERTVEVNGTQLRGKRVVIATGSRPWVPPIPGLADTSFWTSRDVFDLAEPPSSLIVLGGGYIGCEMATFFHGMGVDVTVVQRSDKLLAAVDEDAQRTFQEGFVERVPTILGHSAVAVAQDDEGRFHVELAGTDGTSRTIQAEALLVATGRRPNADALGLEHAGVEVSSSGHIVVDDHLRTSAEGVFALGDVNGGPQFTHAASWQAAYLQRRFLEDADEPLEYGPMPSAVFAVPEIASVGETEQELRGRGADFVSTKLPYTTAAKGRAIKERHGLAKLILAPDGAILGAHIVGHQASVLMHEVIPVMRWRNHISSLTGMIHIHPSLSEIVRNVARRAEAALSN